MNDLRTPDYSDFRVWAQQLALFRAKLLAELNYAEATHFCSDCPRRDDQDEDGRECCKENGGWEEMYEADYAYVDKVIAAQKALLALIPADEELKP